MHFGYIGISYKNATLDVRDNTAFTDSEKMKYFRALENMEMNQCMILSTCNRSEVYFFFENDSQYAYAKQKYKETFAKVDVEDFWDTDTDEEALQHLFLVTAGLESQVLGEDQILGQVKEALDFSRTMGYCKKQLDKVVRDAIHCAKQIKTQLRISEIPLSVAYVGISGIQKKCGIEGKRVLLIGSGKTSELALTYLLEYRAGEVVICSRNREHSKRLQIAASTRASACNAEIHICDFEDRYDEMTDADIIISATASPHRILKTEHAPQKFERAIWMLDLASPRDIDTAFSKMTNCHLMDLDHISEQVKENLSERERLREEGLLMLKDMLKETNEWLLVSKIDSTIESLQLRCSEIVSDGLDYLNRKLDLSTREQAIVERTLQASLQRLLKEPIQELKQLETEAEQEKYKKVIKNLFHI